MSIKLGLKIRYNKVKCEDKVSQQQIMYGSDIAIPKNKTKEVKSFTKHENKKKI